MKHVKHAYRKVKSHVKTQTKIYSALLILILLLIPMYISWDLRSTPAELPIAQTWAENSIRQNLLNQVMPEINTQFPLATNDDKQKIAQQRINELIAANPEQMQLQIDQGAANLRAQFQDANGQTYLVALDPYYYFRFVRNIVDHGYAGEYLNENGDSASNFIRAPEERVVEGKDFHTQFSVFLYKVVNMFKSVPLETTFFFVPVLIMCLAAIPAFFIGLRLAGPMAGFFSALFVVIHPSILPRTIGGFADTDAYNIFFPLLIAWLLIEAIENRNKIKQAILGALTGLTMAVYSTAWTGWSVFVYLIIGTLIISFGLVIVKQFFINHKSLNKAWKSSEAKHELQNILYIAGFFILALFIVLAILGTSPIGVINTLVSVSGGSASLNAATSTASTWPNILTTVAELNNAQWSQIVSSGGGGGKYSQGIFFIALFGAILLLFRKFKKGATLKSMQFEYALLFTLWIAGTAYMSLAGVRFILLVAPAVAVLTGVAFGLIAKFLGTLLEKTLEIPKVTATIVVIIIAAIAFQPIFANAEAISEQTVPSMNDQFYNSLIKIKDNSQTDAIISSWWDFGHQFITIAERGATADGGSQGYAVFVGQALATNDPERFVRLSNMMNCGNNQGINEIYAELGDMTESVKILENTLLFNKEDATAILMENGIEQAKAQKITGFTHCEKNVESFWIASEDMIGKAPVWGHFGLWNFTKAKAWKLKKDPAFDEYVSAEFNTTAQETQKLKTQLLTMSQDQGGAWISPWPRYYSGGQFPCQPNPELNGTFICPTNQGIGQNIRIATIIYDPANQTALAGIIQGSQQGIATFAKYTSVENNEFVSVTPPQNANSIDLGVSFFPTGDGKYSAMIMDASLTDSMFNRMFFYGGFGLEEYIELFDSTQTVTGQRILTFKRIE